MKQIVLSADEVVPLTKHQFLTLILAIACVFQFVLFATPVLAEESVRISQESEENVLKHSYLEIDANPLDSSILDLNPSDNLKLENNVFKVKYGANNDSDLNNALYYGPELEPTLIYQGELHGYKQALPEALELHKIVSVSYHTLTAYNSDPAQTDDTPCITANGFDLCEHWEEDTIAANFLKFGTKVMIPELFGDRIFIVRDRMNKRFPYRVDVWMKDYNDAKVFGVKYAKIYVIE